MDRMSLEKQDDEREWECRVRREDNVRDWDGERDGGCLVRRGTGRESETRRETVMTSETGNEEEKACVPSKVPARCSESLPYASPKSVRTTRHTVRYLTLNHGHHSPGYHCPGHHCPCHHYPCHHCPGYHYHAHAAGITHAHAACRHCVRAQRARTHKRTRAHPSGPRPACSSDTHTQTKHTRTHARTHASAQAHKRTRARPSRLRPARRGRTLPREVWEGGRGCWV